jgi:hypothetical protein
MGVERQTIGGGKVAGKRSKNDFTELDERIWLVLHPSMRISPGEVCDVDIFLR